MNVFKAITPERVAALARETMSRPTAPFREDAVIAWAERFAAARPWTALARDADGNVHLSRRGARRTARPVVFSAHMDHPGFAATACARDGRGYRVEAAFRGGVEDRYFAGARARFFSGVRAVVKSVRRDPKTGEKAAVLAAPRPVAPGEAAMWDLPAFRRAGDRLWSRAVDDLAGVTAILTLFDALSALDPRGRADVRGLLTRGEEVGFWGAIGAARAGRIPPGATVVSLEASKALPTAPLGAGPILRTGDRASVFDDGVTRSLAAAARGLAEASKGAFRWQRKLMDGGTCEGTAFQAYGLRTGALCVPLLNYHNMGARSRVAAEAADLGDLTGLVRWMAAWSLAPEEAAPLRPKLEKMYTGWTRKEGRTR